MKTKFLSLTILGLIATSSACKKFLATDINGGANTQNQAIVTDTASHDFPVTASLLAGKWNIVTDSTFTGVGLYNVPLNYAGQTGDYFNFAADGNVYTKEGAVLDTLPYYLVTDTTMVIKSFGITLNTVPEKSHIKILTAHNLKIVAPVFLSPGGEFGRNVSLSR